MVEIDHCDIHLKYNLENHKQINLEKIGIKIKYNKSVTAYGIDDFCNELQSKWMYIRKKKQKHVVDRI